MEHQKTAIIAAEIKISLTSDTIEDIETFIRKIRDACKSSDYKLNIAIEGDFFKTREKRELPVEFNGEAIERYRRAKI